MIVNFAEQPQAVFVHARPDGLVDAYLRRNVQQTDEGWQADEVHSCGRYDAAEIAEDFEAFWDAFEREGMTPEQRIDELEAQNAELRASLAEQIEVNADTAMALIEVYEMLGGEE